MIHHPIGKQNPPSSWRFKFLGLVLLLGTASAQAQSFNQTVVLGNPKDPQTGMSFHESSDPHQVCAAVGFPAGAVEGSVLSNDFYSNQTLQAILIGSNGIRSYQTGYGIAKIRCFTGNAQTNPTSPTPQFGRTTKIVSINGSYDANNDTSLSVQPGDMITLSADVLSNNQPTYSPVETFMWSANDSADDTCDASDARDCLATSNFQVTDYGVAFYVPYGMGQSIQITVRDRNNAYSFDTLTLTNSAYTPDYQAPTTVVTSPDQYQRDVLDPNTALAGQGRWVVVNGQRYFVPYTYVLDNDNDDEWVPYRNGYWSRDQVDGEMIWVSYDPWGWVTDHYGYWRYHSVYGWIWSAFRGDYFRYHRHTVTFFDNNNGYLGWYPYFAGYRDGYYDGYDQGFRDGFWAGYAAAQGYGSAGYYYRPGFTVIGYNDCHYHNIRNVYIRTTVIVNIINDCHRYNRFQDRLVGRAYINALPPTRVSVVRGNISGAVPVRQVPQEYGRVVAGRGINQRIPVGSVIDGRGNAQQPRVVSPTTNGRGVVVAPRGRDQNGNTIPLPRQTTRPAEVNPQNPNSGRINRDQQGPVVNQPGQQPQRPNLPPVNPRRDQPTPQQPQQPQRPAPMPQPQQPQRPAPMPQPQQPQRPAPMPQPQQPQRPAPMPQPQQPQRPAPMPQPQQPQRPAPMPQPQQPQRPAPMPQPQQPQRPAPMPQPQQPQRPAPMPQPQQPRRESPGPQTQPQRPAPMPGNGPSNRPSPGPGPRRG